MVLLPSVPLLFVSLILAIISIKEFFSKKTQNIQLTKSRKVFTYLNIIQLILMLIIMILIFKWISYTNSDERIIDYIDKEAKVEIIDNEIIVTNENSSIESYALLKDIILETNIVQFTRTYLGEAVLSSDSDIYDVSMLSTDRQLVLVRTKFDYDESKEYANYLADYLIKNTRNAKVIITRYIRDEEDEIKHEYDVYIEIKNGEIDIKSKQN